MFTTAITAIFSFIIALPSVYIFIDKANNSVNISLQGDDELLEQCIKSGFTLSYNFESQICKKSFLWMDDCLDKKKVKHLLTYDTIAAKYKLHADTLGDIPPAEVSYFSSLSEAKKSLNNVTNLSLEFISNQNQSFFKEEKDTFLKTRVTSDCIGSHNRTIGDISYYLTLGLYRMSGFDTGWQITPYNLSSENNNS